MEKGTELFSKETIEKYIEAMGDQFFDGGKRPLFPPPDMVIDSEPEWWESGEWTFNEEEKQYEIDKNNKQESNFTPLWKSPKNVELNMPTSDQLIGIAILFNDGNLDSEILGSMVGMCQYVLDRLKENNDILKPSSKETIL